MDIIEELETEYFTNIEEACNILNKLGIRPPMDEHQRFLGF